VKEFLLKEHERKYANRYGRIGNVKDRLKEDKILPAYKGHPCGHPGIYKREIKHIHYFALQEFSVTMPEGSEVGDNRIVMILHHTFEVIEIARKAGIGAICKYQPVKHTVQQVAQCTGKYQRTANHSAPAVALIHQSFQQEKAKNNGYQAKGRKQHFAHHRFTELHAICHAFVFDKMQPEPTTDYLNIIPVHKMGLYIKLQHLVGDDDE